MNMISLTSVFLGMRKALIDAIRIRFLKDERVELLYDKYGNAYKLEKWIDLAKQRRYISKTEAGHLKGTVKVFGDTASHDYMADLHKEEVPQVFTRLRIILSRMYYEEESTQSLPLKGRVTATQSDREDTKSTTSV